MSHDSRGALLKKGDRVLLEGILAEEPTQDGGYCNCQVSIVVPDQRDKPPMTPGGITLNTRMLTKIGACLLLLLLSSFIVPPTSFCQEPPKPAILADKSQVDRHEILRRGANVSIAGEGMRDSADLLYSMAMSPPADDSDQWQVTLFGPSNDPATLALYEAFQKDPALACFVAAPPIDGKRAWAHFNWYRTDDRTQQFRVNEFAIPASGPFPIVVLQPPRDGSFGGIVPAKTVEGKETTRQVVVDRIDANRDPAAIGRRLKASVKLWCDKLAKSNFVPPPKLVARYSGPRGESPDPSVAESDELENSGTVGHAQQPPFPVPAPSVPFNPIFPPAGPAVDPTPAPSNGAALAAAIAAIAGLLPDIKTILLILTALSNVWMLYREIAGAAGIKLLIDEATYQRLKDLLAKLSGTPPTK